MGFSLRSVAKVASPLTFGVTDKIMGALEGPKFPGAPGLSPEEQQLQQLRMQFSGLYDANGNLDPAKVAKLKAQGSTLQKLQFDRYQRALEGTLPASVGLQQEQADAFKNFKTLASRQGGRVQGTGFDNSFANSTAANQRLMGFQKAFGLRADEERRAELNRPYDPFGVSMGFLNPAAQAAQGQRELQYNAALTKYAGRNARQGQILGLVGQLGGAALTRGASAAAPAVSSSPNFLPPQTGMGFSRNPYNMTSYY